jgi:hypothetical protein
MSACIYQDRYWKELYQLRVHVNYLEIYIDNRTPALTRSS